MPTSSTGIDTPPRHHRDDNECENINILNEEKREICMCVESVVYEELLLSWKVLLLSVKRRSS